MLTSVLQQSRTGATMLLLGFPYGPHSFNFEQLVGYDKTVVGSVGSSREDFEGALATLPRLDLAPLLQSAYPLEEFKSAWNELRSRTRLKVMLKVDASAV